MRSWRAAPSKACQGRPWPTHNMPVTALPCRASALISLKPHKSFTVEGGAGGGAVLEQEAAACPWCGVWEAREPGLAVTCCCARRPQVSGLPQCWGVLGTCDVPAAASDGDKARSPGRCWASGEPRGSRGPRGTPWATRSPATPWVPDFMEAPVAYTGGIWSLGDP